MRNLRFRVWIEGTKYSLALLMMTFTMSEGKLCKHFDSAVKIAELLYRPHSYI